MRDFDRIYAMTRREFIRAISGKGDTRLHTDAFISGIDSLWKFSEYRGTAWQDSLGLLDAAVRYKSLSDFSLPQIDALCCVLYALAGPLHRERHEEFIKQFARLDIDILRPILGVPA